MKIFIVILAFFLSACNNRIRNENKSILYVLNDHQSRLTPSIVEDTSLPSFKRVVSKIYEFDSLPELLVKNIKSYLDKKIGLNWKCTNDFYCGYLIEYYDGRNGFKRFYSLFFNFPVGLAEKYSYKFRIGAYEDGRISYYYPFPDLNGTHAKKCVLSVVDAWKLINSYLEGAEYLQPTSIAFRYNTLCGEYVWCFECFKLLRWCGIVVSKEKRVVIASANTGKILLYKKMRNVDINEMRGLITNCSE